MEDADEDDILLDELIDGDLSPPKRNLALLRLRTEPALRRRLAENVRFFELAESAIRLATASTGPDCDQFKAVFTRGGPLSSEDHAHPANCGPCGARLRLQPYLGETGAEKRKANNRRVAIIVGFVVLVAGTAAALILI